MFKTFLRIALVVGAVGLAGAFFSVGVFTAFADIAYSTLTNVQFLKDDKPFMGDVEYSVKCYGWTIFPDDFDREAEIKASPVSQVYSYSATCPGGQCKIYEGYYLNYRDISYCNLEGTVDGKAFEVKKFATTPYPEECQQLSQYMMSDGDNYYRRTDAYDKCMDEDILNYDECEKLLEKIPDSEIQKDQNGNALDRICEAHFALPPNETLVKPFPDVETSHKDFYGIDYVKSEGIVSGYDDGTFKPDATINRAEFVRIIISAVYDKSEIENCVPIKIFKDVKEGTWYAPYVCAAANAKIVSGYSDGTFRPGDPIEFTEAALIVVKTFWAAGSEYATDKVWYEPFVKSLQDVNAVPTSIDALDSDVTRGEFSEIIYRIKEKIDYKESKNLL